MALKSVSTSILPAPHRAHLKPRLPRDTLGLFLCYTGLCLFSAAVSINPAEGLRESPSTSNYVAWLCSNMRMLSISMQSIYSGSHVFGPLEDREMKGRGQANALAKTRQVGFPRSLPAPWPGQASLPTLGCECKADRQGTAVSEAKTQGCAGVFISAPVVVEQSFSKCGPPLPT